MQEYQKHFEIPETEERSWQTIYNEVVGALYDPKVDGPRISGSCGGPLGSDGVWVILENLHDPEALYLNVTIRGKKLDIHAQNVTDEKIAKITEVCRGFREVPDASEER